VKKAETLNRLRTEEFRTVSSTLPLLNSLAVSDSQISILPKKISKTKSPKAGSLPKKTPHKKHACFTKPW